VNWAALSEWLTAAAALARRCGTYASVSAIAAVATAAAACAEPAFEIDAKDSHRIIVNNEAGIDGALRRASELAGFESIAIPTLPPNGPTAFRIANIRVEPGTRIVYRYVPVHDLPSKNFAYEIHQWASGVPAPRPHPLQRTATAEVRRFESGRDDWTWTRTYETVGTRPLTDWVLISWFASGPAASFEVLYWSERSGAAQARGNLDSPEYFVEGLAYLQAQATK
jgi:hypothetical protein